MGRYRAHGTAVLALFCAASCSQGALFNESVSDNTAAANRGMESDVSSDGTEMAYAIQPVIQCTAKGCETVVVAGAGIDNTGGQVIEGLNPEGQQSADAVTSIDIPSLPGSGGQDQGHDKANAGGGSDGEISQSGEGYVISYDMPGAGSDAGMPDAGSNPGGESNDAVMGSCLDNFAGHPFTYEDIGAAQAGVVTWKNVNNKAVFSDDVVTAESLLKRIDIVAKNANQGRVFLANPNGWYCITVNAKNINNFKFIAHCDAHLAVVALVKNAHQVAVERFGCD